MNTTSQQRATWIAGTFCASSVAFLIAVMLVYSGTAPTPAGGVLASIIPVF